MRTDPAVWRKSSASTPEGNCVEVGEVRVLDVGDEPAGVPA